MAHREAGQDLVEYAVLLPALMMLLLGIAEFAIIVFSYDTLASAVREGARYGIIHPADTVGIESHARRMTTGLDPAALTIQTSYPGGNTLQVQATYDYHLLTGFLVEALGGSPTLRLRAATTMQIE